MHPLLIIAAAAGTAYVVHLLRSAKAAKELKYQLQKIQIYKINWSEITLRVFVSFTNLEAATLTVKQIYLDIFLNIDGSKHRIGTLNTDNIPVTLPGYATVQKSFDVKIPLQNFGIGILKIFQGYLTNGSLSLPDKAFVEGQIKTLGFTIPVNIEVPFNSTPSAN